MGARIAAILMLLVIGAIVADLVIHYTGTGILVNGVTSLWRTGLNSNLGVATDASGNPYVVQAG